MDPNEELVKRAFAPESGVFSISRHRLASIVNFIANPQDHHVEDYKLWCTLEIHERIGDALDISSKYDPKLLSMTAQYLILYETAVWKDNAVSYADVKQRLNNRDGTLRQDIQQYFNCELPHTSLLNNSSACVTDPEKISQVDGTASVLGTQDPFWWRCISAPFRFLATLWHKLYLPKEEAVIDKDMSRERLATAMSFNSTLHNLPITSDRWVGPETKEAQITDAPINHALQKRFSLAVDHFSSGQEGFNRSHGLRRAATAINPKTSQITDLNRAHSPMSVDYKLEILQGQRRKFFDENRTDGKQCFSDDELQDQWNTQAPKMLAALWF